MHLLYRCLKVFGLMLHVRAELLDCGKLLVERSLKCDRCLVSFNLAMEVGSC